MKSTLQRLEEIKRNGYRLDIGEVINDTFSNYKNIALLGGAVLLLVGIVYAVVFGGAVALIVGVGELTQTITDFSAGNVTSTYLIGNFIGSVLIGSLSAPIIAGLVQMAHNSNTNEEFDFGTAFMHYSTKYFKELFFGAAIIALFGTGTTTAIEFIKLGNMNVGFVVAGSIISFIISVLVYIFTLLMIPLIIFGDLNAIDAIKGSFVLVSKNFWIIIVLAIVFGVFIFLGIFALCIGILFTYPAWFSMIYTIYTKALPIENADELEEIGKNFY